MSGSGGHLFSAPLSGHYFTENRSLSSRWKGCWGRQGQEGEERDTLSRKIDVQMERAYRKFVTSRGRVTKSHKVNGGFMQNALSVSGNRHPLSFLKARSLLAAHPRPTSVARVRRARHLEQFVQNFYLRLDYLPRSLDHPRHDVPLRHYNRSSLDDKRIPDRQRFYEEDRMQTINISRFDGRLDRI